MTNCARCVELEAEIRRLKFHLQAVVGAEGDLHVASADVAGGGLIEITARRRDVRFFQERVQAIREAYPDVMDWEFSPSDLRP